MHISAIHSAEFTKSVDTLRVPGAGTEVVAPLLATLVQFCRPRTVLEVGMGYTTPFIAAALAALAEQTAEESVALAGKTRPYLDAGTPLDEAWLHAGPSLLTPSFYTGGYRPVFVAVDDFSLPDSSAARVGGVLRELGLDDHVTVVDAGLRDCVPLLPEGFTPIDLAWVDAWECLYFFDHCWDLINPDGGLVVMHYLMTYPEGEAILRYFRKLAAANPGELEVISLLEPHKLTQNSITMLRRTSAATPRRYADPGGRLRYGGQLRDDAVAHARAVSPL